MFSHKTFIAFLFFASVFGTTAANASPIGTGAPACDAFLEEMAACFDQIIQTKDDQDNVDAILALSTETMRNKIQNSSTKAAVIDECKATMKQLKKEGCEALLKEQKLH